MNIEMVKFLDSAFEIGKYPITQKQWQEVMGNNPSHFTGHDRTGHPHRPVEMVSWHDVQVFLTILNNSSGSNYRLPTIAEWTMAAGAEPENILEHAWILINSKDRTHKVGTRLPNEFGIYDMRGNVWEWLQNEYNGGRALCGGSWDDYAGRARAAYLRYYTPCYRDSCFGFRVARTLPASLGDAR